MNILPTDDCSVVMIKTDFYIENFEGKRKRVFRNC